MRDFNLVKPARTFVYHFRNDLKRSETKQRPIHLGATCRAVTVVCLVFADKYMIVGTSACSWQDSFNKKRGILIATGRAKKLNVSHEKDNRIDWNPAENKAHEYALSYAREFAQDLGAVYV